MLKKWNFFDQKTSDYLLLFCYGSLIPYVYELFYLLDKPSETSYSEIYLIINIIYLVSIIACNQIRMFDLILPACFDLLMNDLFCYICGDCFLFFFSHARVPVLSDGYRVDIVSALVCTTPLLYVNRFVARHSPRCWPRQEVMSTISTLPSVLVKAPAKCSHKGYLLC